MQNFEPGAIVRLEGLRSPKSWALNLNGGFPKLGYFLGDPYKKGYSILGAILGYPILGNYQTE